MSIIIFSSFTISPSNVIALLVKNSLASLRDDAMLLLTKRSINFVSSVISTVGTPLNATSISLSDKDLTLPVNSASDIAIALSASSLL